jgi:hypothetical protein
MQFDNYFALQSASHGASPCSLLEEDYLLKAKKVTG